MLIAALHINNDTVILEINAVILLMRTWRVIFRAHLNKNIY